MKNNKDNKDSPRFGSRAAMINFEITNLIDASLVTDEIIKSVAPSDIAVDELVVLSDDYGNYLTVKSRLDTGMADPNRYYGYASDSTSTSISQSSFSKREARVKSILSQ
jgi:hypothetical protein